jgi:aspartate-semialdehyde dehydrogenase
VASGGVRIGVVGATGALGSELLVALSESSLPVREIVPIATDRSLGRDVEFQGEVYPVVTEGPSLRGLDLVFLCAPAAQSLEFVREALRAEVACIDLSGATAESPEVPLRVAEFGGEPDGERAPVVATPTGPALAWALVLRPLDERARLERVTGTSLEGASVGGRDGIESLYAESLAIFSHQEAPEAEVFPGRVAFDCLPAVGPIGEDGHSRHETLLARTLGRLLGPRAKLGVTSVQVPTFLGHGAVLVVETEEDLEPGEAVAVLDKAPGVEVWREGGVGPSTRTAAGRDAVLVGRVRRDPSRERSLLLWLAADLLRLSAANAVRLATPRLLML